MTLEEAIWKEEALAYSFGERYKRLGEPVGDLPELEAEHSQYAEWFKELKYYKDRQDLINKSWQELINYKEGVEKIKIRSQAYRECGESILASGMEQALDILEEVNADEKENI